MIQALKQNINHWDTAICLRVFGWNGRKFFDVMMRTASRFGDGYYYPFIGLMVFLLDRSVAKMLIPAAMIAFAIELPLHKLLKHKVRRIRPCHMLPEISNLVSLPDEFSFPSGHTAAAFLMATLLGAFYPFLLAPAFVIAAFVGISRIYNGVHFPADVIAGSLIGILSAKTGLVIIL